MVDIQAETLSAPAPEKASTDDLAEIDRSLRIRLRALISEAVKDWLPRRRGAWVNEIKPLLWDIVGKAKSEELETLIHFKPRNKTDLGAITEFHAREVIKGVERGRKTLAEILELRPNADPILMSSPENSILFFVLKLARHAKAHPAYYNVQSWVLDPAITDGDPEAVEALSGILQDFSDCLQKKVTT